MWLERLGAEVHGLSLEPEADALYSRAALAGRWDDHFVDVRRRDLVQEVVSASRPDLVFHLAAQPLVNIGYSLPVETFETNVLGTINVLEAVRQSPGVKGCVVVTTDKVYLPSPTPHQHREADPLGGSDPYAASKAAAEHVSASWRSLMHPVVGVVAARAGNVVGGGDATRGRLVPDLIQAFSAGRVAEVRHPDFTRPWQHVLDPLSGYLTLGALMAEGLPVPPAINFGPLREEPVAAVADLAAEAWQDGAAWEVVETDGPPETPLLSLDSSFAREALSWTPTWDTRQSVGRTVMWWKELQRGGTADALCLRDIDDYMSAGVAHT